MLGCIREDLEPLCDQLLYGPRYPHELWVEIVANAIDPYRFTLQHGRWRRPRAVRRRQRRRIS